MKHPAPPTPNRGFTLMEMLIVVSIIAILFVVILVGLKPVSRMADSRDARRAQDLNQILIGIHECSIDKKDNASLSTCLGSTTIDQVYEIVSSGVTSGCAATCTGVANTNNCLPLNVTLSDYFTSLPNDPTAQVTGHTGYSLERKANGMVVLEACAAENGPIIVSQ